VLHCVAIGCLVSLLLVVQVKELLCPMVRLSLLQSSGKDSRNID